MDRILVTGGAGFIGSNFVHRLLSGKAIRNQYDVVNLDKLTYAGNLDNLRAVEDRSDYRFVEGDICDPKLVGKLMKEVDYVVNFAAETHVDRSIEDAGSFIQTDVYGTFVLLEAMKAAGSVKRFIHISTDEVYGSIQTGSFKETDPLMPRNPYSASKAGADRLAYSYFATYGLPIIVTRASNNYGPYQYPEKLIPLFVTNLLQKYPVPLYGDGKNVRDWLHVSDHCSAVEFLLCEGKDGEVYNIGGGNETENIKITKRLIELTGRDESFIRPVKDRQGHDRRYSLDTAKLRSLGWKPEHDVEQGLVETVNWYKDNEWWWKKIRERPEFSEWWDKQYVLREQSDDGHEGTTG